MRQQAPHRHLPQPNIFYNPSNQPYPQQQPQQPQQQQAPVPRQQQPNTPSTPAQINALYLSTAAALSAFVNNRSSPPSPGSAQPGINPFQNPDGYFHTSSSNPARHRERIQQLQQQQQQHQQQQQQQQAQSSRSVHPSFRTKTVCQLDCKYCDRGLCNRGMKAILLADTRVELFSTDAAPTGVSLVADDYTTRNCQCRIRDVACLGCGNVVGYHVTQPCLTCLSSCNNGHFWMFHDEGILCTERRDPKKDGNRPLLWAELEVAGCEREKGGVLCR